MRSALYKQKNNKIPCSKLLRSLACIPVVILRLHGVEGDNIKIKRYKQSS